MPPASTKTGETQAGCYFDNEVIPPGAPRPKLPWAYTYAKFDQLLQAYPEFHPEDFVTFGILQEAPRRRSHREWGEVAGVLAHMIGGRQSLVTELTTIVNRIQRLTRDDPMRATEERALLEVLLRERRRSKVPIGDGAFALLAAPGGSLVRPAQPGPHETPVVVLHRRQRPTLSLGRRRPRENHAVLLHPSLGPPDPGETSTSRTSTGAPEGPGLDHVVPRLASPTSLTSRPTQTRKKRWTRRQQLPLPTSARATWKPTRK